MAKLVNEPLTLIRAVYIGALRARCEEVESGWWKTRYGELIALRKLELSHLANILNMYVNERSPFDVSGIAERMVRPLLEEARRRGYKDLDTGARDRFELIELE